MISGFSLRGRPWRALVPAVVVVLAVATNARTAHADFDAGSEDLPALEKQLGDQMTALSTSDCATACRALASIRRAAQKICALDPDERCKSARAKADDATRRVREACPECVIADLPDQRREERPMSKGASRPEADAPGAPTAASAPPSDSQRRGGCASCSTIGSPSDTGTSPTDLGSGALAVSALAFVLRRRRAVFDSRKRLRSRS